MSKRKYWIFAAVFLGSVALDQITKMWARESLQPLHHAVVVVNGFFDLRYSENPYSAFGLLRGIPHTRELLLVVGVIALGVIGLYLRRLPPERLRLAAELGLLAGGAVGNIADRVRFGRVTDFIVWKVHSYEWPTFNVADAALVVGLIALLLDAKSEDTAASAAAPAESKPKRRSR
jgi:signal peptidase II